MKTINHMKLGGMLLIIGVAFKLLMNIYLFVTATQAPFVIRTIGLLFGRIFISIYRQFMSSGHGHAIQWEGLIYLPWAGLYLVFLGWLALTALNGKFNRTFVPVVIASAAWYFIGLLFYKLKLLLITGGMYHFFEHFPLRLLLNMVVSEITLIMMIIGLSLLAYGATREPASEDEQAPGPVAGTGFWDVMLSLNGRLPRSVYWMYFVFMSVLGSLIIVAAILGLNPETGFAGIYLLNLFLLWPSLAISVKRCHDRNRSGWFILVGLIPVIGLWYAIEMLFLRGSAGENRFGPEYSTQPVQSA